MLCLARAARAGQWGSGQRPTHPSPQGALDRPHNAGGFSASLREPKRQRPEGSDGLAVTLCPGLAIRSALEITAQEPRWAAGPEGAAAAGGRRAPGAGWRQPPTCRCEWRCRRRKRGSGDNRYRCRSAHRRAARRVCRGGVLSWIRGGVNRVVLRHGRHGRHGGSAVVGRRGVESVGYLGVGRRRGARPTSPLPQRPSLFVDALRPQGRPSPTSPPRGCEARTQ